MDRNARDQMKACLEAFFTVFNQLHWSPLSGAASRAAWLGGGALDAVASPEAYPVWQPRTPSTSRQRHPTQHLGVTSSELVMGDAYEARLFTVSPLPRGLDSVVQPQPAGRPQ